MKYTTATFSTVMNNILPAITFFMAWILRYGREPKEITQPGDDFGDTSDGGAMIMTLVKGPRIGLPWTKNNSHAQSTAAANQQDSIKGSS
ncbi:hypothetical protein RJ639_014210 [Escallonia herrerae]|uniref:Uncharacterized protein n=1 Tax=Escallonia herrerae TaxID=1293975 RepID=A0AA88VLF3_9ASTE|nr:hypothetical protein RJ639_014210 [Escallonia herrerae]